MLELRRALGFGKLYSIESRSQRVSIRLPVRHIIVQSQYELIYIVASLSHNNAFKPVDFQRLGVFNDPARLQGSFDGIGANDRREPRVIFKKAQNIQAEFASAML